MRPATRLTVAGYDVRGAAGRHGGPAVGPAVLYDVTGPDGRRLLYATDTGVLPDEAVALARDRAYDAVLLELSSMALDTHLDLASWPAQVERLRAVGAVVPGTQVVAVHLGHGNPPPDVLDALLASWGARAGRDGEVVELGRPAPRRVLVLGGARSGKSAYAEGRLAGEVTYVATAPDRPGDAEWAERVAGARRPPAALVDTVETGDVAGVLRAARGPVLVDDLGLWLARRARRGGRLGRRRVRRSATRWTMLAAAWRDAAAPVVLVAPEVGGGVVPEHRAGRVFRDLLGTATARLAARRRRGRAGRRRAPRGGCGRDRRRRLPAPELPRGPLPPVPWAGSARRSLRLAAVQGSWPPRRPQRASSPPRSAGGLEAGARGRRTPLVDEGADLRAWSRAAARPAPRSTLLAVLLDLEPGRRRRARGRPGWAARSRQVRDGLRAGRRAPRPTRRRCSAARRRPRRARPAGAAAQCAAPAYAGAAVGGAGRLRGRPARRAPRARARAAGCWPGAARRRVDLRGRAARARASSRCSTCASTTPEGAELAARRPARRGRLLDRPRA